MKRKGGWRVGCCIARKSQRVTRNSDATQDVREGKKNKIQHADTRVSVFHSATATFCAPSNPSGLGGMYQEVIHSTPLWSKGDIAGPRRDCVFVDMVRSSSPGMQSLLVARIYLPFKFLFAGVGYPCALVHWYTMIGTRPDGPTGLWAVEPKSSHHGCRNMGVVHLDSIVRGAHLLP